MIRPPSEKPTARHGAMPRNWIRPTVSAAMSSMVNPLGPASVGGTPRLPGGDNLPSESTPMDLAKLAQRFPQVAMICGHSGGDWELGVRAIRPYKNILLEFAGSEPHSRMVEYEISELGVDRLVWGGHGPSRSSRSIGSSRLGPGVSKRCSRKI